MDQQDLQNEAYVAIEAALNNYDGTSLSGNPWLAQAAAFCLGISDFLETFDVSGRRFDAQDQDRLDVICQAAREQVAAWETAECDMRRIDQVSILIDPECIQKWPYA